MLNSFLESKENPIWIGRSPPLLLRVTLVGRCIERDSPRILKSLECL